MGVINHNAVIATTWSEKSFLKMQEWVASLEPFNTPAKSNPQELFHYANSLVNCYYTVILTPDGSKEGWDDSDRGDELRDRFVEQLGTVGKYEDGSSNWEWVEVSYGEFGQQIVRGNNVNCY